MATRIAPLAGRTSRTTEGVPVSRSRTEFTLKEFGTLSIANRITRDEDEARTWLSEARSSARDPKRFWVEQTVRTTTTTRLGW